MFKAGLVLIFSIATVSCVQFGQKETSSAPSIEDIKSRAPSSVEPYINDKGILVRGNEVVQLTQYHAIVACKNRGMRLPTILELAKLRGLKTVEVTDYPFVRKDLEKEGYEPITAQDKISKKIERIYYKTEQNDIIPKIFAEVENKTFWSSSLTGEDPYEAFVLKVVDGNIIRPKISLSYDVLCIKENQSTNSDNSDGSDIERCQNKVAKLALEKFEDAAVRYEFVNNEKITAKAGDWSGKFKEVFIKVNNIDVYKYFYELVESDNYKSCDAKDDPKLIKL